MNTNIITFPQKKRNLINFLKNFTMSTVLITGATSGIGEACVKKFSENGAFIIAIGRNRKKLNILKKVSLEFGSENFMGVVCDFNNHNSINKLFKKIKNIKKLDCIINSAGIAYKNKIENLNLNEWDKVMKINVTIPYIIIKKTLPLLYKSKNASIINISSIAGRNKSISLGCHYTTSKSAIIGMTRHLAGELGPKGIRVNCCAPSQTITPMLKKSLSKKAQNFLANTIPLRRLSTSSEQAEVIFFLSTNKASYVNGAIIDVNGGLL